MSIDEQKALKEEALAEARRYMKNARETYKKAGKEGRYYLDRKYVKGGANYAYHECL